MKRQMASRPVKYMGCLLVRYHNGWVAYRSVGGSWVACAPTLSALRAEIRECAAAGENCAKWLRELVLSAQVGTLKN